MTKISLSTVFVHLLVYLLSMRDILTMTADPADYIWINYNSKQPMTKISNNQYTATLPCESRIGKCSFRYNLLPLGWQANRNGMLTIPESDAVRQGAFSVMGEFEEGTGQKLSANLIVEISNGFLKAYDSTTYFNKAGYKPKQYVPQQKKTQYRQSTLTTDSPQGFPTIQQLRDQITKQQQSHPYSYNYNANYLTTITLKLLQKYAPCRSKINYLNKVASLFREISMKNGYLLQYNQNTQKRLTQKLKQLKQSKSQRISQDRNLVQVTNQIAKLKQKIVQSQKSLQLAQIQRDNYKKLASQTLQQIQVSSNILSFSITQPSSILIIDKQTQQTLTKLRQNYTDRLKQRSQIHRKLLASMFQINQKKVNITSNTNTKKDLQQFRNIYKKQTQQVVISIEKYLQNRYTLVQLKCNKSLVDRSLDVVRNRIVEIEKQYKSKQQQGLNQQQTLPQKQKQNILKYLQNIKNRLTSSCTSANNFQTLSLNAGNTITSISTSKSKNNPL